MSRALPGAVTGLRRQRRAPLTWINVGRESPSADPARVDRGQVARGRALATMPKAPRPPRWSPAFLGTGIRSYPRQSSQSAPTRMRLIAETEAVLRKGAGLAHHG